MNIFEGMKKSCNVFNRDDKSDIVEKSTFESTSCHFRQIDIVVTYLLKSELLKI